MKKAIAGYELVDEIRFSVYFVNGTAMPFTLESKEDVSIDADRITINVSTRDVVVIERKHVVYTRFQIVTMRRVASVPGDGTLVPQTSELPNTSSDEPTTQPPAVP
jgi:hypothetical protein